MSSIPVEMPENQPPAITLIIPNFNGANLLRMNLPSVIKAADEYRCGCRVIVVDDASVDDSIRVLETEFPRVDIIRHERNRGFADAIQSGVDAADTECLIFLNSDVRPDVDFILPLVEDLQSPDVFSVTPLVVDGNEQPTEESWRCYRIHRGRLRLIKLAGRVPTKPVATLFASGGSMAVRKSRFNELGGFLPLFKPFYSEDSDLGIRAWRRGWRSLFEPRCRIVHDHAGSSINTQVPSARVRRIRRRNQFLLEWIHVPGNDLWLSLAPRYLMQALVRMLRLDFSYFGGLLGALVRIPRVLAIRTDMQRTRVIEFWEVMNIIERSLAEEMAAD